MKAFVTRTLRLAGLAPAAHLDRAHAVARKASEKAARLEERVETLRGETADRKRQEAEAAAAIAKLEKRTARAEAEAGTMREELLQARAEAREAKARADALSSQVRELRERLDESRRVATRAREHLMATEVKLDLVEAAIHVLDTRTRDGAVRRP